MSTYSKIGWLLLWLWVGLPAKAQVRVPYFFHRVGESEKLPLYSCRTLMEDNQGNLWVGTYNGIFRFDGIHATFLEGFRSKDAVQNKFLVTHCEKDPIGNLWFSHSTGLTKVNPLNLKMDHFDLPANNFAINHRTRILFIDPYDGLYLMQKNGQKRELKSVEGKSINLFSPAQAKWVFNLKCNPGHFWISGQGKILRVSLTALDKIELDNPGWIEDSSFSSQTGWFKKDESSFWKLDVEGRKLLDINAQTGSVNKKLTLPPTMRVQDLQPLIEDGFGNIWLAQGSSKVWVYLASSKAFVPLNHGNKVGEFQSTGLGAALFGKNNTIWLGTDNGILAVQPNQNWLNVHHIFNPEDSALKKDRIMDLTYFKGDIWLTCAFGKLMKYNPVSGKREVFVAPGLIPGQSKDALPQTFYSLFPFQDELLIGTRKGLVLFHPGRKQFYTRPQFQKAHWQHLISLLVPEKDKFIWAWAHDKRWIRIRKSDLREDSVPQFPLINGKKTWISKPLMGPNQEFAFELPSGYGVAFPSEREARLDSIIWVKNPIWPQGAFSINSGWNGKNLLCRIVFPTGSYLMDLNKKKYLHTLSSINPDYELFKTCLFDKKGSLWLADQNAIGWLNPKSKQFFTYHFKFGTGEFMYDLRFINGDGDKLFLKSMYEVAEIDPSRFAKHPAGLHPWFSSVKANGELLPHKGSQTFEFTSDQNNLSLEVGFLIPEISDYSIEYNINDQKWKPIGKGYRLDLISLDPGDYRIALRAISKDGFFKSKTSIFECKILPPFYRTFWFWALIFLILASLVYFYFRRRWTERQLVFDLETKALNLEKEKTIVQYESLKQQLNPHFLFNSLTSLGSLIRIDPKMAATFLEAMSKSYRYILKSQEQELVPLRDELQFIQNFIQLQKVRFEEALRFEVAVSEEDKHLKIVPVTLQNLVENAIKHNVMDEESPLHIRIFVADGYLHVENNLQKKAFVESSNKKGLKDLRSLYGYLDNRPVKIEETDKRFCISIPLI